MLIRVKNDKKANIRNCKSAVKGEKKKTDKMKFKVQKLVLETWKVQETGIEAEGPAFFKYWIFQHFLFFWSAVKSICDFSAKI